MNTERIEELLERLIDKQDEIISRLDAVESVLEEKLNESNYKLSNIEGELNWWENKPTLAKQLLAALGMVCITPVFDKNKVATL